GANKSIAPIVEREPMLSPAADRCCFPSAWIDGQVAAAERNGPGVRRTLVNQIGAAAADCHVDPIVEPPLKRVDKPLHVASPQARVEDSPLVGDAIAARVLEKPDIG